MVPWLERDIDGRPRIPEREIRDFAARVAARYKPLRIILFGSYARGDFNGDSDVDLLVITQKRRHRDLRTRMRQHVPCPFPLDLIVTHEARFQRRVELGDFFLREIMAQGRVLYESADAGVGEKSGGGLRGGRRAARSARQTAV